MTIDTLELAAFIVAVLGLGVWTYKAHRRNVRLSDKERRKKDDELQLW